MTALAALAGALAAIGLIDLLVASTGRSSARNHASPAGDALAAAGDAAGGRSPAARKRSVMRGPINLLAAIGRRLPARAPASLAGRIDAAGSDATVAEVMALKVGAAVSGLASALLMGAGVPSPGGWLLLLVGPLVGFLGPDAWLRRRMLRRRRAMQQQLGDVLELLRVAVEAGLTVPRALAEVGRRHPGVLAAEIAHAAGLLELGVTQRHALEALVRRCPAAGVTALAAALSRAERHGAPLGDALAAQAEEARARRARAAIEHAARAAPKIQLIVALLLVPSAMLLMAAAMLPTLAWR